MTSQRQGQNLDREDFLRIVRELFATQQLGVLSTMREDGPYPSLVGFVSSDDLGSLFFATPRATRKHENIRKDPRVALLIDSRTNRAADFKNSVALTAYGTALELEGIERKDAVDAYIQKFPHLDDFVNSPSCGLMKISVSRYSLVRRFQDVVELDMA